MRNLNSLNSIVCQMEWNSMMVWDVMLSVSNRYRASAIAQFASVWMFVDEINLIWERNVGQGADNGSRLAPELILQIALVSLRFVFFTGKSLLQYVERHPTNDQIYCAKWSSWLRTWTMDVAGMFCMKPHIISDSDEIPNQRMRPFLCETSGWKTTNQN